MPLLQGRIRIAVARAAELAFCSLSKCRKAAAAASTKTAPWQAKLKELDDDMDDMLHRLEKLEATVDRAAGAACAPYALCAQPARHGRRKAAGAE